MGGFVRNITGQTAAKRAGREAAAVQQAATDKSLETLERLNSPFINLGAQAIEGFQPFLDDPSGASFLQNNPMFQAALDYTGDQLKGSAAAAGKFNSGGLTNQLFQNYLATGDQFVNSAYNRAFQPVALGQNAASLQGNNISNLLTGNANAQGAAITSAGMLPAQQFNNLLQAGATGVGAFLSDERTKEDIKLLGKDSEGNNVYEYSYKHDEKPKYVGYMAQEIAEKDPDNVVVNRNGLLMVGQKYMPKRVS